MEAKDIQKYQKKSIPDLIKIATKHFNKFIRDRDRYNLCISCGQSGTLQAGHYLSAGHHGIHRFNELNCHGQCVRCNMWLSGNLINYRIGLIRKIGEEAVKELEDTRNVKHKWDRFTLIDIILKYK